LPQQNGDLKSKRIYGYVLIGLIPLLLFSCSTVRLTKFKASDCKESCSGGLISNKKNENKTTIVYGCGSYCCLKFSGRVKFKNDTLFLHAKQHRNPCRCHCTYELTYEIKGLKDTDYEIKIVKDWDWRNARRHKKNQKLTELRTTNPEKYEKLLKRKYFLMDFFDNLQDHRANRKQKQNRNPRPVSSDDVYF